MPEIVGRLRSPRLSGAPASPALGELYYNTSDNTLYWWNGTAWQPSGGGGADLVYNGAFPTNTPYTDGDIVIYNGVAYLCVRPTSATPTPWAAGPPFTTPYATTLPASPYDGQEAILVDSLTNPSYQWRFRYNAGSTSAYKWECIGCTPMRARSDTNVSAGTANVWNLQGPILTLPRAGDYDFAWGMRVDNTAAVATYVETNLSINGAAGIADANDSTTFQMAAANSYVYPTRTTRFLGQAAGTTIQPLIFPTSAMNCMRRWLEIRPVRVS